MTIYRGKKMITSESTNIEFYRFFKEHEIELSKRLVGLLVSKHRRVILSLLKNGGDIPPIWGTLKLPEATLYMLPIGIKKAKVNFEITSTTSFMVMKDLRKQTPIFITYSKPHAIMYSVHAVRRYKERLGIDPETDFVDVCKHMVLNGCSRPRIFGDMSKIYGTNINHRQINFTSVNGAYMGYVDGKTEVLHAETFLSVNELRKDQLYLDAKNSEDLILWKAAREAFAKGEITLGELKSQSESYTTDIAISDGRIIKLTPEEARLRDEANKKAISDPEYFEKAKEENRQRYSNKVRRKGYK